MKEGLTLVLSKIQDAVDTHRGVPVQERIRRRFLTQVFERLERDEGLYTLVHEGKYRQAIDEIGWKPNPRGKETIYGIVLVGDPVKEAIMYGKDGVMFVQNKGKNGLHLFPLEAFETRGVFNAEGLLADMTEQKLRDAMTEKLRIIEEKLHV